jgi:hypothetical protein
MPEEINGSLENNRGGALVNIEFVLDRIDNILRFIQNIIHLLNDIEESQEKDDFLTKMASLKVRAGFIKSAISDIGEKTIRILRLQRANPQMVVDILNKISENIKEAENNLEEFKIILDQLQSLTNHLKERKQGERSFIINNLDNIDTNFNELKNYLNRFKKALGFRL